MPRGAFTEIQARDQSPLGVPTAVPSSMTHDAPISPAHAIASLDPPETSDPPGAWSGGLSPRVTLPHALTYTRAPASPCLTFRHSGWAQARARVLHALQIAEVPDHRLHAFAHCGSEAFLLQDPEDPTRYRVAGSACHDRFCVPCARDRSRRIASNVLAILAGKPCRLITLTIKTDGMHLADAVDKLIDSFRRLRKRPIWKSRVDGGAAFLEVTYNSETRRWHPHYHCLTQGRYVPQGQLASEWREITGDSYIVDVRMATDERRVAHYVTKYVSKPLGTTKIADPDTLVTAVLALSGRRLCQTFGTWRGYKLCCTAELIGWLNVGTLADWLARARNGDAVATHVLRSIDTPAAELAIAETPARSPPASPTNGARGDRTLRLFPAW